MNRGEVPLRSDSCPNPQEVYERVNPQMLKRLLAVLLAVTFLAAACGSDDDDSEAADTAASDDAPAPDDADQAEEEPAAPVTGPAAIAADDQTGDGTAVTVASVTLPTAGFVVIHADSEGAPGPILGWSDLLPAGDSTDVVVTLNTVIDADATVFPMAHVDANDNGEYEFMPPDVLIDIPATNDDGTVAVLPINYTVG